MDADKTLTVILDLGSELVRGGTEVWLVEERLAEICDAYGFKTHDILIVSDYIKATVQTYAGTVHSQIRKVPGKQMNMERLELLAGLSERIVKETPEPGEIEEELQKILKKPSYPRVIIFLAAAFGAGNFTMFFNGWRQDVALVALIALVIVFVREQLSKREDNPLITNTLLAYLMEIMVVGAMLCGLGRSLTSMTAGLIMLLIGPLGFTTGMRDLLHKNVQSGLTDFMHSLLGAMGIAIGISLALMTFREGIIQHVQEQEVVQSVLVQIIASIGGCVGFAVGVNCRGWVLVVSGVGAALTQFAHMMTLDLADGNYFTATLIAACFAAFYANISGLTIKTPPTIFLTTCVLPLLPGPELYRLVYAIIMDDGIGYHENGRRLFLICIAIALGYIIVEVIFKYTRVIFKSIVKRPA